MFNYNSFLSFHSIHILLNNVILFYAFCDDFLLLLVVFRFVGCIGMYCLIKTAKLSRKSAIAILMPESMLRFIII